MKASLVSVLNGADKARAFRPGESLPHLSHSSKGKSLFKDTKGGGGRTPESIAASKLVRII